MRRENRSTGFVWLAAAALLIGAGCGDGETDSSAGDSADSSAGAVPASVAPPPSVVLRLTTSSGPAGSSVSVHATGLQPDAQVELGFGGPQSDFEILVRGRSDANGDATLSGNVPTWAEVGKEYRFTIAPVDQPPVGSSDPFAVTPPPPE
jgi:hypothetical protein